MLETGLNKEDYWCYRDLRPTSFAIFHGLPHSRVSEGWQWFWTLALLYYSSFTHTFVAWLAVHSREAGDVMYCIPFYTPHAYSPRNAGGFYL